MSHRSFLIKIGFCCFLKAFLCSAEVYPEPSLRPEIASLDQSFRTDLKNLQSPRREISTTLLDPWDPLQTVEENNGDGTFLRTTQQDRLVDLSYWLDVARDGTLQQEGDTPLLQQDQRKTYLKTGTTIVGLVVQAGTTAQEPVCILAADTRATAGTLVADRRADKLHRLGKFASAAGAGTSADLEHLTRECQFVQKLATRLEQVGNNNEQEQDDRSVLEICRFLQKRLLEQKGNCQANLILGGIDPMTGTAHLRALHPHGSVDVLQYAALGSGGLAAMSILERGYPLLQENKEDENMVEKAKQLVMDAVRAGIVNDLGSGSQVDLCVISAKNGCQYTRCVIAEEELPFHAQTPVVEREDSEPGVNGFGNLPFSVRSTRSVRESERSEKLRKLEQWKDILVDEQ